MTPCSSLHCICLTRGCACDQGASPSAWGRWTRQWTAEENRHGDAMNKYMYMSGCVNMKVCSFRLCMAACCAQTQQFTTLPGGRL